MSLLILSVQSRQVARNPTQFDTAISALLEMPAILIVCVYVH